MKLYHISDLYINYLRQFDNKVLENHFVKHDRKYLGLGFVLNGRQYYIPLSHPDPTDFVNGKPRNSVIPIFRLVTHSGRLLGKLLLNNMIPVPSSELTYYDLSKEQDTRYRNLVLSELRIIKANTSKIIKNANTLYKQKSLRLQYPYLSATVDFQLLETKCDLYK